MDPSSNGIVVSLAFLFRVPGSNPGREQIAHSPNGEDGDELAIRHDRDTRQGLGLCGGD